ncbi:hypothetical protein [Paenibacillus sp. BC26]|uniref:hypothetical protein n=1 Tax=Paenibacillus sp. BC26 TaxID=1881032 RepID=UPI0011603489|nr:hypothetical protein [Paenibacillus sp. BC26]
MKIKRYMAGLLLGAALLAAWPIAASAHFEPVGYSDVAVEGATVEYALYMDPYQLMEFVDLDLNSDGYVDEAEVKTQAEALKAFMGTGLQLSSGGATAEPVIGEIQLTEKGKLPMVRADLLFTFAESVENLDIEYAFFQKEGFVHHLNMAHIQLAGETKDVVFTKAASSFIWNHGKAAAHRWSAVPSQTMVKFGGLAGLSLLLALCAALWKRRRTLKKA